MIRFFCRLFKHPGVQLVMDESGEFVVRDCKLCSTIIIQDFVGGHEKEDYEAVLDRWLVDWGHDGDP